MSAWLSHILVFCVGMAAGLFVASRIRIGRVRQQSNGQMLNRLVRDSRGFFDALRSDFNRPEFAIVREFAIVQSIENTFVSENLRFVYYKDEFPDLKAIAEELDKLDFVDDVTTGKTPIYGVREQLVVALRNL